MRLLLSCFIYFILFWRKNRVYDSIVGITRESGFYVIIVKTMVLWLKVYWFLFGSYRKWIFIWDTLYDISSNKQNVRREYYSINKK